MNVPQSFIEECRSLLTAEYLPRIDLCLQKLSDEAVWWRPNNESNSIGNLLLHLAGNVRQWIGSGIGGAAGDRNRQQEFDERARIPKAELLSNLRSAVQEADIVLASLDPQRLLDIRPIQGRDVTLLYAILHVAEHFSMHTGQIILLAKAMLSEDLQFYDMTGGVPVRRWRE